MLWDDTTAAGSHVIQLQTRNYVIGGMPETAYQKKQCHVGDGSRLYVFSDGVYEIEKADGSMWRFHEFMDFVGRMKPEDQSVLDRLHAHALHLGTAEIFQDDFTIIEVVFQ